MSKKEKETDQRTISELELRYELHPELADVYVEGHDDVVRYSWFLERLLNSRDVKVYSIESVKISPDKVEDIGLRVGNKGRVVFLAKILGDLAPCPTRATCVVDRDTSDIPEELLSLQHLLVTDFPAIESYCFTEHVIDKLLKISLRNSSLNADAVLIGVSDALRKMFSLRVASDRLGLNLGHLSITAATTLQAGKLTFDKLTYIEKYLNRGKGINKAEEANRLLRVSNEIEERWEAKDPRTWIHGHDLVTALSVFLRPSIRNHALLNVDELPHVLFSCIEFDELVLYPHFAHLGERMR